MNCEGKLFGNYNDQLLAITLVFVLGEGSGCVPCERVASTL